MLDIQSQRPRALLIVEATHYLKASNIGDARRNVEWMLCELLKCNRASLYAYPEAVLPQDLLARFQEMLARRAAHEPLQYILGYTEFFGLRFDLTPDVLIPRPETELLVEEALALLEPLDAPKILDVGTGSGCIPVAIKYRHPIADVYSCDVSAGALALATRNAARAGVEVTFFQCDILQTAPPIPTAALFDLIVSNPPYIPEDEYLNLEEEVRRFEPRLALSAGDNPLVFYRAIGQLALQSLKPGSWLLFETHCDYATAIARMLERMGYDSLAVLPDLAGFNRIVKAVRPI